MKTYIIEAPNGQVLINANRMITWKDHILLSVGDECNPILVASVPITMLVYEVK